MAVKFEEAGHKYYTLDGRELISVSALMKRFEEKKDWTAIAKKVAKKEGKSLQEVLDLWEYKRNKGTEAGTIIHKIKENELLAKKGELSILESEFDGQYKYALKVNELQNNTIYPELMIYDLDHMVCGQSDEVEIKNGIIEVRDHKTDKEIKTKAFSNDFVPAEKLLGPLRHLDNCNFNTYSLKMSLYMYLIWRANRGKFKPGKILLNWCPIERDEDEVPVLYNNKGEVVKEGGTPRILFEKVIEVPYRKKEVIAMLETLKK